MRRASAASSTRSRLCPTSPASAARTAARTCGVAPTTSTSSTAKSDVSRATAYPPAASASRAKPTSSERAEGASRDSSGRLRPTGTAAARAVVLRGGATRPTSPRLMVPLRVRQRERAEELHLVRELDPEPVADLPPRLGHQRDAVGGGRAAGVLDEVRVTWRDLRAADRVPLEPA